MVYVLSTKLPAIAIHAVSNCSHTCMMTKVPEVKTRLVTCGRINFTVPSVPDLLVPVPPVATKFELVELALLIKELVASR